MPLLPDLQTGALSGDDPKVIIDSLVRQLNEWARLISAETRVRTIKGDDGSIAGVGQVPDTEDTGFFNLNADGNLVSKWVGDTLYFYDSSDNVRIILGTAPDDTVGLFISKTGEDLTGAFS